ncbi:unnamed protein product [Penicillium olsonii]|nr:unnamed protein product [Penicillium olsonii]
MLRFILLLIPLVNAWTFRYTNEGNETEIIRGSEERNCTVADIFEDKLFTWDPEGTKQCVSIYRDKTCDSMGGYSCTAWRKNASRTFMAFDIMPENLIVSKAETSTIASTSIPTSEVSTSTPSSTSTSITPSTTSSSVFTPTSSPEAAANTDSTSSTSLSGGAIAGVVIGVVAAVAIIVALIVFFMKRQKKTPTPAGQSPHGLHEADGTGSSMSGTTADGPFTSLGFQPVPGSRFVELKGDAGSTELGSSPISELDASSPGVQPRRF